MFCWKCGKEISQDAKFCSACGAQAGGKKNTFAIGNMRLEKTGLDGFCADGVKRGVRMLGDCKVFYFGAILGLVLGLFLLGAEMFEVTVELFYTRTERFTMFEDKEFWKFAFILAYILAATTMLVPLLTGKGWGAWNMYPAIGVPAVTVVVFLLMMVSALNQMGASEIMGEMEAKASLTVNGWFFVLINIVTASIAIKATYDIAENQTVMLNEEIEVATEKEIPYWCANCDMEGPYDDVCPRCGSKSKRFFKL